MSRGRCASGALSGGRSGETGGLVRHMNAHEDQYGCGVLKLVIGIYVPCWLVPKG